MSVRTRTLITIGATLSGLIIVFFIGACVLLMRSFSQLEMQHATFELQRAEDVLLREQRSLGNLAGAWAASLTDNTPLTTASFTGITDSVLAQQHISFIAGFAPDLTPVIARQFDGKSPGSATLLPDLRERLRQLARRSGANPRWYGQEGLLQTSEGTMMVAARPLRTGKAGASTGFLLVGRALNRNVVDMLEQAVRLPVNLYPSDAALPADVQTAMQRLVAGQPYYAVPVTGKQMAGYRILRDIDNAPAMVLRVRLPRGEYSSALRGMQYFTASLLFIGLALCATVMLVLERQVLAPLAKLSGEVHRIGERGTLTERLPVRGQDELARVADAVNGMLAALDSSQEELHKKEALRESEERYRALVEMSPDAVLLIQDDRLVFANETGIELLGAESSASLLGRLWLDVVPLDDRDVISRRLRHLGEGQEWLPTEAQLLRLDGAVLDVELTAIHFTYQERPAVQLVARDITERKRDRERLNYLAYFDSLTGLPNRQLFNDRLAQALALAHRREEHVTVIVCDLDRFKEINDTLGHHVGDRLLQAVTARLKTCMRESDTISRIGGDEFFLIMPNTGALQSAETVARKILAVFGEPHALDGHELYITASLGVSIYPADGISVEALVKNADTAMYRAKAAGRNNYMLYRQEMGATVTERRTLESKLRKALDRGELTVHYQPKVDLNSNRVVGMEALARWPSPELGMVPPMLFIPLAEEIGLIEPIGEFVLHAACAQNRVFQLAGYPHLQVAVNLSVVQFQQTTLVDKITRILQETMLPPHMLELEITESVAMQNIDYTLTMLRSLDDLGVSIAIDDFGTGYSSFSYLTKFPINTLKIDRSFIQDITHSADDASIVAAIIAMTHSLRRRVVAEAVETEEQLDFLRLHNCDEVQGYLFGKPVPPEEFLQLVERINAPAGVPVA